MLVILIPCYNEEFRFPLLDFELFLYSLKDENVHICFINDGSTDNTSKLLSELVNNIAKNHVFLIDNKVNKGKAECIRIAFNQLFNEQNYTWFAYLDADFATHPNELISMYNKVVNHGSIKMVMGARWLHLGSEIHRNPYRHYFGRFFATIASYILSLKVYDTQCGAKLLHRDYVECIKNEVFISRWIFDVEILARIINKFGVNEAEQSILEYPLNKWTEVGGSKIKFKDLLILPFELFKIKFHYKL